ARLPLMTRPQTRPWPPPLPTSPPTSPPRGSPPPPWHPAPPFSPPETNAKNLLLPKMKDPPPLEQLRRDLPPPVPAMVRKMLAKRPEHRFQTPAEVAQALAPLVTTVPALALAPVPANAYPLLPANRDMDDVDMPPSAM